ncbi:hypothetical protein AB0K98_08715 [Streptomyces werraensis]|uniref:hypothetical protein n=1 Tax=Streptomyces werraensis TaxID=68284 RepID=UPI001CE30A3F
MDKTTAPPGLFEGANNGADGLKVWSDSSVGTTGVGAGVYEAYGTGGRRGEAEDET